MIIPCVRVIEDRASEDALTVVMIAHSVGFLVGFTDRLWFLGLRDRLLRLEGWRPASPQFRHGLIRLKLEWNSGHPPLAVVVSGIFLYGADSGARQTLQFCRVLDETHCLTRLQRWFVRENARRRQKRLALCMALHPRLGRDSPLHALDPDLLRTHVISHERREKSFII
jgi:hypothetical protein